MKYIHWNDLCPWKHPGRCTEVTHIAAPGAPCGAVSILRTARILNRFKEKKGVEAQKTSLRQKKPCNKPRDCLTLGCPKAQCPPPPGRHRNTRRTSTVVPQTLLQRTRRLAGHLGISPGDESFPRGYEFISNWSEFQSRHKIMMSMPLYNLKEEQYTVKGWRGSC